MSYWKQISARWGSGVGEVDEWYDHADAVGYYSGGLMTTDASGDLDVAAGEVSPAAFLKQQSILGRLFKAGMTEIEAKAKGIIIEPQE